jgi:hypothetical protein
VFRFDQRAIVRFQGGNSAIIDVLNEARNPVEVIIGGLVYALKV